MLYCVVFLAIKMGGWLIAIVLLVVIVMIMLFVADMVHPAWAPAKQNVVVGVGPVPGSSHRRSKSRIETRTDIQAVIPGGLTSMLQPLDVVLNKPFKDRVRQHWLEWMGAGLAEKTAGGNLKKPALALVTQWVKDAWGDIPEEMVIKSFLKTGISNNLDGTEDDALWDESEDNDDDDSDEDSVGEWDTDEKMTLAEWEALFGKSDDESDFDGF